MNREADRLARQPTPDTELNLLGPSCLMGKFD
jgi:hypothetical protein